MDLKPIKKSGWLIKSIWFWAMFGAMAGCNSSTGNTEAPTNNNGSVLCRNPDECSKGERCVGPTNGKQGICVAECADNPDSCQNGFLCVEASSDHAYYCLKTCDGDQDCGDGQACLLTSASGKRFCMVGSPSNNTDNIAKHVPAGCTSEYRDASDPEFYCNNNPNYFYPVSCDSQPQKCIRVTGSDKMYCCP